MHKLCIAFVFCAGASFAQNTPEDKPVTRTEFVLLFDRFTKLLNTTYMPTRAIKTAPHGYGGVTARESNALNRLVGDGIFPAGNGVKFDGAKPATRFQAALSLDRLVQLLRPKFIRTSSDKNISTRRIRGVEKDGSQAAMLRLAKGGFIPFGSPLFEGPGQTIHPRTMSALLAQAAERIAWHFRKKDTKF